jgi:broad specificity phosphatase PhoE
VVGQANAQRLADRLAGEHVVAIFSTDTRRTRDSAAPTATKNGLETELYDPADNATLAARIAKKDGSVLVVGHSNTVPGIVATLSGQPQPDMDERRYGDLFIIDLRTRSVTVEHVGP